MIYHQTLEDFALDHTEFSEKEFVEKYPHPFLVVNLDGGVPMLSGRLACATTACEEDADGNPFRPGSLDVKKRILVAPVVKTPRNRFKLMVTVGRTNQNDIVLPARSISKFHAYFQQDRDSGALMLTDGGSKFGTILQGEELHEGKARELHNGNSIVFARVARSTFLLPDFFFGYLQLNLRILERWKADSESV
ncbi:MAG: FHA domain-containing protein [Planctomycetota bacterium]